MDAESQEILWDNNFTPPEYLYKIILVCMFFGFILFLIFFALVRFLRYQNKARAILRAQQGDNLTSLDTGTKGSQDCKDIHGRSVKYGSRYVPGPDACTLCVCESEGPIWCKAVLCSPPKECKSVRAVNTCCQFICLDDTATTGGPYGPPGALDIAEVIPKVIIASVCSMLSLALLLFLVYRLRQKHLQGRMNSAQPCHPAQMCDECDDTRSLDFSTDCFFDRTGIHPHMFPPHYMASWKPPSSYFPPRGEAPPPYEEAIASSSNCVVQIPMTTAVALTSDGTNSIQQTFDTCGSTIILTNENIQNPSSSSTPLQCNPCDSALTSCHQDDNTVTAERNSCEPGSPKSDDDHPDSSSTECHELPGASASIDESHSDLNQSGNLSSSSCVRPRATTEPRRQLDRNPPAYASIVGAGNSPRYSGGNCRHYFRHSLTLPRHPSHFLDFDIDLPIDYPHRVQQRYSLQFNVADWSSSSSTLSLSSPNTPDELRPDSSFSSSSSSSNGTEAMP